LVAALEKRFAQRVSVDTTPGDRGIFDVSFDGDVVFSKHTEGRFPDEAEIEQLLEARLQQPPP
jgi:selT/selW/selH-like putative selenoprotein